MFIIGNWFYLTLQAIELMSASYMPITSLGISESQIVIMVFRLAISAREVDDNNVNVDISQVNNRAR